jgi:hypothetical protein
MRGRMAKRLLVADGICFLPVALLVCGSVVCSPKTGDTDSQLQIGSGAASSGVTIGRFRPETPPELQAAPDSVDVPIRLVEFVYPVFAPDTPCAGTPGRVLLAVAVGPDSVASEFRVVQTDLPPECREYILTHLMDVVRRSTFWPALKSGRPVASVGVFPVSFAGPPSDTDTTTDEEETLSTPSG